MKEASLNNFGLLIAYLVPGFVALWGASYFSETLQVWLGGTAAEVPTVGGFLYVTVGSVAAGLTASTIRWVVIDTIHHRTGIPSPQWDFSRLQENVAAYHVLVEIHYRYYQFYANSLVALLSTYLARRTALGLWATWPGWLELGLLMLGTVFFAASRDTLRKYQLRVGRLLGEEPSSTN